MRRQRRLLLKFFVSTIAFACAADNPQPETSNNASPILGVVVPPRAQLDASVTYDFGSTYDPDGRITNYFILVPDGTPRTDTTQLAAAHLFLSTGTFDVTLGATDDRGATTTAIISIEIRADPDATCDASATCSGGDVCAGGTCVPGTCTSDAICLAGFQCAYGYCRLPGPCPTDGGACPGSPSRRCVATRCLPTPCRGAADCESGQSCVDGGCAATN